MVQVVLARPTFITPCAIDFTPSTKLSFVLHPLALLLFYSKVAEPLTPCSKSPSLLMNHLFVAFPSLHLSLNSFAQLTWSYGMRPPCSIVTFMKLSTAHSRMSVAMIVPLVACLLFLVAIFSKFCLLLNMDLELKLLVHAFSALFYGNTSKFSTSNRTCALPLPFLKSMHLHNGSLKLVTSNTPLTLMTSLFPLTFIALRIQLIPSFPPSIPILISQWNTLKPSLPNAPSFQAKTIMLTPSITPLSTSCLASCMSITVQIHLQAIQMAQSLCTPLNTSTLSTALAFLWQSLISKWDVLSWC